MIHRICKKCGKPKGKSVRELCISCAHWGRSNGPHSSLTKTKLSIAQKKRFAGRPENHPRFGKGTWPDNPTKNRASNLRRSFNLTLEDHEKMLAYQNGNCAICGRPETIFKRKLSVDHDHKSHIIRGLLCWPCNSMLVARHDLPILFNAAIAYLTNPPAITALGGPRLANPIKRRKRK